LLDLLRENNVALALQAHSYMPGPEIFEKIKDPLTANFAYIRLLGDWKGIEKLTTTWNKTIIDRTTELQSWVSVCEKIQKRGIPRTFTPTTTTQVSPRQRSNPSGRFSTNEELKRHSTCGCRKSSKAHYSTSLDRRTELTSAGSRVT
jgi:hypothetical protein